MSQSGFLKDLSAEDAEWLSRIQPFAETNEVIVEDNAIEYRLNEADEYVYQSEEVLNGVNVTSAPIFRNAGMDGEVFLCIIANAQRAAGLSCLCDISSGSSLNCTASFIGIAAVLPRPSRSAPSMRQCIS